MKKILVAVVLAAVLCLLVGPFATGLVAKRGFEERLSTMNQSNPWFDRTVTRYNRGWFSSQAVVEFAFKTGDNLPLQNPDELPAVLREPVPVVVDIDHGPVHFGDGLFVGTARVTARPDTSAELVSEVTTLLGVPYLFEFRARSAFGGRLDFDADVPPFTVPAELGEVRFSGLEVDGIATRSTLSARGAFAELALQGGFAAGAIESVAFDFDYELRPDRLPLSNGTLTLARAVASSPFMGNEPLFELSGLSIDQSIAISGAGETLDARVEYASDRLMAGSDTDLANLVLGIRVAGVDSRAAAEYYAVMNRAFEPPALEPEQLMEELAPVLESIVRRGVTIEVEPAGFATELGTLDANVLVTVDGSSLPTATPVDVRNIAVLLGILAADADLTVTKALARDLAARALSAQLAASSAATGEPFTPDELAAASEAQAGLMLATLAGQGMLDDDGTNYRMTVRFEDGSLTVNGAPLGSGLF